MNIPLKGEPNYEDPKDRNFGQLQLDSNDKWRVDRNGFSLDYGNMDSFSVANGQRLSLLVMIYREIYDLI